MTTRIITGDCLDVLGTLPDQSINCCVTSPPYWGLRQYLFDGAVQLRRDLDPETRRRVEAELAAAGIKPRV
jgi:DNA modification methylase